MVINDILRQFIVRYTKKLGGERMVDSVWCWGKVFHSLDRSMNKLGWKTYTEGMLSKGVP